MQIIQTVVDVGQYKYCIGVMLDNRKFTYYKEQRKNKIHYYCTEFDTVIFWSGV